jgi:DNA modification methylase
MKPLPLIECAIENSSKPGDLLTDLFLGSGSTLIACERTGRTCFGIEIDPNYASIILSAGKPSRARRRRWWHDKPAFVQSRAPLPPSPIGS